MNKKQLLENLIFFCEQFENERNLDGGLLKCRSGNVFNACLQFVNQEYISPNKIEILYKEDHPSEYSLFKVSAFFDVYESLCFNYDFIARPSGFSHLSGISRSTIERWGRVATTEYKQVSNPYIYNINNTDIYNNTPISSNNSSISDDSITKEDKGVKLVSSNDSVMNFNNSSNVIQGSSNPIPISITPSIYSLNNNPSKNPMLASLVSTDLYKKILFSNLETVTNKMQGGEGNTVGFITEYNAVREDIQERTDVTQEIVADVKAIATRYGVPPMLEDNQQGVEDGKKTLEALIYKGLTDI